MITSNCKQKENKPKEISLLRHGVAHYVLVTSRTKQAAHGVVQADRGSPWCRALCPHIHCRAQLMPELIPIKLFTNGVQEEVEFVLSNWNPGNKKLSFIYK